MKLILGVFFVFGLFCGQASANAIHLNPSQPANNKRMVVFGKTSIPIGYYRYCQRYQTDCMEKPDSKTVRLTRNRWAELVAINNEVNSKIKPMTDQQIFGVEEWWVVPERVGDCEDYALLKRKRLLEIGYPLGSLLMTVGRDADGGGHAVLTVVTDRGDYILDNVEQKVLLWQDTEIRYLKRQSRKNPNVWVGLVSG